MRALLIAGIVAASACASHAPLTCDSAPFSVTDSVLVGKAGSFRAKTISNYATLESATIVWESGGIVADLFLRGSDGKLRDVIEHTDADKILTDDHYAGAVVLPWANRIANGTYEFGGKTHYLPRNDCDDPADRCVALHGFLKSKTMVVDAVKCDADGASLTLVFDIARDTHTGYPFAVHVSVTYRIKSVGGFEVTIEATNAMENEALPWSCTWHPYFKVSDVSKAVLQFDKRSGWNHVMMAEGAPRHGQLIPTGRFEKWVGFDGKTPMGGTPSAPTYYDDEFVATVPSTEVDTIQTAIIDPPTGQKTVLWADRNFRVMQVFSGGMEKWGASAIAVEAMNTLCDAFNNHEQLTVLAPGEKFHGTFGVYVE